MNDCYYKCLSSSTSKEGIAYQQQLERRHLVSFENCRRNCPLDLGYEDGCIFYVSIHSTRLDFGDLQQRLDEIEMELAR